LTFRNAINQNIGFGVNGIFKHHKLRRIISIKEDINYKYRIGLTSIIKITNLKKSGKLNLKE
jgi:hypothetical protein